MPATVDVLVTILCLSLHRRIYNHMQDTYSLERDCMSVARGHTHTHFLRSGHAYVFPQRSTYTFAMNFVYTIHSYIPTFYIVKLYNIIKGFLLALLLCRVHYELWLSFVPCGHGWTVNTFDVWTDSNINALRPGKVEYATCLYRYMRILKRCTHI